MIELEATIVGFSDRMEGMPVVEGHGYVEFSVLGTTKPFLITAPVDLMTFGGFVRINEKVSLQITPCDGVIGVVRK